MIITKKPQDFTSVENASNLASKEINSFLTAFQTTGMRYPITDFNRHLSNLINEQRRYLPSYEPVELQLNLHEIAQVISIHCGSTRGSFRACVFIEEKRSVLGILHLAAKYYKRKNVFPCIPTPKEMRQKFTVSNENYTDLLEDVVKVLRKYIDENK